MEWKVTPLVAHHNAHFALEVVSMAYTVLASFVPHMLVAAFESLDSQHEWFLCPSQSNSCSYLSSIIK